MTRHETYTNELSHSQYRSRISFYFSYFSCFLNKCEYVGTSTVLFSVVFYDVSNGAWHAVTTPQFHKHLKHTRLFSGVWGATPSNSSNVKRQFPSRENCFQLSHISRTLPFRCLSKLKEKRNCRHVSQAHATTTLNTREFVTWRFYPLPDMHRFSKICEPPLIMLLGTWYTAVLI